MSKIFSITISLFLLLMLSCQSAGIPRHNAAPIEMTSTKMTSATDGMDVAQRSPTLGQYLLWGSLAAGAIGVAVWLSMNLDLEEESAMRVMKAIRALR